MKGKEVARRGSVCAAGSRVGKRTGVRGRRPGKRDAGHPDCACGCFGLRTLRESSES